MTVKSLDPEIGLKCVFPFTLRNGRTYNACTAFAWSGFIGYDAPRCSTKVDDDGVHIDDEDNWRYNWGECSNDCPLEGQNKLANHIAMLHEQCQTQRGRGPATSGAPPPPPTASGPASTPEGPLAKFKPAPGAAVPKLRGKAPKAPAPHTGFAARRTVILPPLSRLNRAQLENLAVQWEVETRGKTVA